MNSATGINNWTIYKITNPIGRVYIGKSFNYKKRIESYKSLHCKSQPALFQSFKKYGFINHNIETVETFKSAHAYASDKEMFWIRTYMSNKCKWPEINGLNLTDGGDGSIGCKYTPEQKEALSKRMKGKRYRLGKYHNLETKRKISETKIRKGDGRGKVISDENKEALRIFHTGRTHTEDTKKKISDKLKGIKYPNRKKYSKEYTLSRMAKFKKSVSKYDLNGNILGTYNSVGEAALEIGGTKSGIANCARGVNQTYKGYKYKYN